MGRPRRIQSAEWLNKRIAEYFAKCEASKREITLKSNDVRIRQELPSMVGLAVFLDIPKSTLYDYLDGKYDDRTEADTELYSDILARARDRIELVTLDAASNGDTDSRITLARLAKFGYSNKVEVEQQAAYVIKWDGVNMADVETWGK